MGTGSDDGKISVDDDLGGAGDHGVTGAADPRTPRLLSRALRFGWRHLATIMAVIALAVAVYAIQLVDAEAKARARENCVTGNLRAAAIRAIVDEGIKPLGENNPDVARIVAIADRRLAPVDCRGEP